MTSGKQFTMGELLGSCLNLTNEMQKHLPGSNNPNRDERLFLCLFRLLQDVLKEMIEDVKRQENEMEVKA